MLWEYEPEAGLRLTHPVDDPLPVTDYLKVMGKYRHLAPEQIEHIERHIAENVRIIKQQTSGAGAAAG
jgi:phenylglyoxylate dehydrogenase beta subunit